MSFKNNTACESAFTTEHRLPPPTTNDNNHIGTMSDNPGTKSTITIDPALNILVKEFFNAQFELKKMQCPFTINNNMLPTNIPSSPTAPQANYNHVKSALRACGKALNSEYETKMSDIIKQLDLTTQNCSATFHCLSNEMFVNGMQWHYIITYFVFSADFAFYAQQQNAATVREVADWLARYITKNIVPWIDKNGGWDGLVQFAQETVGNVENESALFNMDLKNLLCGAAGALGVLSLGLFLSSK